MLEKNISSFFFCFLICQKVIIFFLPTLLRFDENLKKKAYGNSAKEQIIAWNIWTHAVICGGSLNFNVYVFSREILEARPWRKGGPVWMPRSIPWPASWLIWSAALPISLGPHRWVLSTLVQPWSPLYWENEVCLRAFHSFLQLLKASGPRCTSPPNLTRAHCVP